jgi:hypothetical protein
MQAASHIYVSDVSICIYNTPVKTVLEMGKRAREPVGDIREAFVDPTFRKGTASDH